MELWSSEASSSTNMRNRIGESGHPSDTLLDWDWAARNDIDNGAEADISI